MTPQAQATGRLRIDLRKALTRRQLARRSLVWIQLTHNRTQATLKESVPRSVCFEKTEMGRYLRLKLFVSQTLYRATLLYTSWFGAAICAQTQRRTDAQDLASIGAASRRRTVQTCVGRLPRSTSSRTMARGARLGARAPPSTCWCWGLLLVAVVTLAAWPAGVQSDSTQLGKAL